MPKITAAIILLVMAFLVYALFDDIGKRINLLQYNVLKTDRNIIDVQNE